jgi:2-C-methyl-D-erythritol 2,4-cyclodiphosphate synthase
MSLPKGYYAGIGYDVHQLVRGRKLILGGVCVPHAKGLKGHSDADVIVHAAMDALLGAAGLGDIGELFPNTSPKYKGASSISLLEQVRALLVKKRFAVVNVDIVLLAEEPKIMPYKERMRANIARALNMNQARVNVKATTGEGLGFVGAKQGMAAYAIASLRKA